MDPEQPQQTVPTQDKPEENESSSTPLQDTQPSNTIGLGIEGLTLGSTYTADNNSNEPNTNPASPTNTTPDGQSILPFLHRNPTYAELRTMYATRSQRVETELPNDDEDDDEPGSAFSSSSSEYSDRSESERPLYGGDGDGFDEEDRSNELEDFDRAVNSMIGPHPNSADAQLEETPERPTTPPRMIDPRPKEFSPRTRRRLENEAARNYHYEERPTRRGNLNRHPNFWTNAYGDMFYQNIPRRRSRRYSQELGPSRLRRSFTEDDIEDDGTRPAVEVEDGETSPTDAFARPATPEPTGPPSPSDDVFSTTPNDESLPMVAAPSGSHSDENDSVPSPQDGPVDQAFSWEDLKAVGNKKASWADEDDDEDWDADLERIRSKSVSSSSDNASRRSSIDSTDAESLPKVETANTPQAVVVNTALTTPDGGEPVSSSAARTDPLAEEPAANDDPTSPEDIEPETRGISPVESEHPPITVNVPTVGPSTTPSADADTVEAVSEPDADQAAIEAQLAAEGVLFEIPMKRRPSVALPSSPLQTSASASSPTDNQVSPTSSDGSSPRSATSLETLEQATELDEQAANDTIRALNEEIDRVEKHKPETKEEAAKSLSMKRALHQLKEDELVHRGKLPEKKRIPLPPTASEERMNLVNARAWDYRRQREEFVAQWQQERAHIEQVMHHRREMERYMQDELDDYRAALGMRNEEIADLKERLRRLQHERNVLESELAWARSKCPVCGADMNQERTEDADQTRTEEDEDQPKTEDDDQDPESCKGRCKELERKLKEQGKKTREAEDNLNGYIDQASNLISDRDDKIAKLERKLQREFEAYDKAFKAYERAFNARGQKLVVVQKQLQQVDDDRDAMQSKETQTEDLTSGAGPQTQSRMVDTGVDAEPQPRMVDSGTNTTGTPRMVDQGTQPDPRIDDDFYLSIESHEIRNYLVGGKIMDLPFFIKYFPTTWDRAVLQGEARRKELLADLARLERFQKDTRAEWRQMLQATSAKNKEILDLKAKLREVEEASRDATANAAEVQRLRADLEASQKSRGHYRTKSDGLQTILDGVNGTKLDLQADKTFLQDEVRKLKARLAEIDATKPKYIDAATQMDNVETSDVTADHQQALQQRDQKIAELEAQLQAEKSAIAIKDEELESKTQELKCKDQALEKIGAQLEAYKQDVAAKDEELETVRGVLERLANVQDELVAREQDLATRNQEIEIKDLELATRKKLIEDKDHELARLRDMLGQAFLNVTPEKKNQPVEDDVDKFGYTPLTPRSAPLPATPLLPKTTPSKVKSSMLSPIGERMQSPMFSPRSVEQGYSSLETSRTAAPEITASDDVPSTPSVLPRHPITAPVLPWVEDKPRSPLLPDPSRLRQPGWRNREASWRNTVSYRNAMERFEKKIAEEEEAERDFEAVRTAAFKNFFPDAKDLSRREQFANYTYLANVKREADGQV